MSAATFKHNPWVEIPHFLNVFGFITHRTLMVDEWEAQNKTGSSFI